jgi:hypothetical protein
MENAQIPNENKRLYVIGDIHGRLDLLDRLIAMIRRDARRMRQRRGQPDQPGSSRTDLKRKLVSPTRGKGRRMVAR